MPFQVNQYFHPLGGKETLPPPPPRFTFPFHYAPDSLAVLAAEELQAYLRRQMEWTYDFGLDESSNDEGQGKMFGVLVVENKAGELGYLAAFSGKMVETYHLPGFVPPVYDILVKDGYYKANEAKINEINRQLELMEADPELERRKKALAELEEKTDGLLTASRQRLKEAKKDRKARREAAQSAASPSSLATPSDLAHSRAGLLEQLARESVNGQLEHKNMQRAFNHQLAAARAHLAELTDRIDDLKQARKQQSNALQQWIFEQYKFLNARGETKALPAIFADTVFKKPIAGAGECAAPKLLQFAYLQGLTPRCMAEFWWGKPPDSAIRQHLNYYPACRGKCEPILGHMLQGLEIDPNPLRQNLAQEKALSFVYEDEDIVVVNKPADFLSVPGKMVVDSVQSRLLRQFPDSTGPIIVHRLDMATSGLLLCAKTKEAHKKLQQQFLDRSIQKRYVAILDGEVGTEKGKISLPLRQDILDRPRQLVDFQAGKPALTKWKKLAEKAGKALVHFWPVTGRTHQLRMHAAHPKGLGTPIVGDRLYGKRADRLYLHAEWMAFKHPRTGARMEVVAESGFEEMVVAL